MSQSKKITIKMTEDEHKLLEEKCGDSLMTFKNYLLTSSGLKIGDNELTIQKIIDKISNIKFKKFKIKDLFKKDEWSKFTSSSKVSVSQGFKKLIQKGFITDVKILSKEDGSGTLYKKRLKRRCRL